MRRCAARNCGCHICNLTLYPVAFNSQSSDGVYVMNAIRPLLNQIARDESLVRGLGDAEARLLIDWLVDRAEELLADNANSRACLQRLCGRGRALARFVYLWCYENAPGAAAQLAAVERFAWPLPTAWIEPCELMHSILECESS